MLRWLRSSRPRASEEQQQLTPEEKAALERARIVEAQAWRQMASDDEDDPEVPMPSHSRIAAAANGCSQPSSCLRRQMEDLRSRNPSRALSPERAQDFDCVLQEDASASATAAALRACLASIFRIPLAEAPDNGALQEYLQGQDEALLSWLRSRGRGLYKVALDEDWRLPAGENVDLWAGSLGILHGTTPLTHVEHGHDVVARVRAEGSLTIVHDPHPEAVGLASPLQALLLFPAFDGSTNQL
eukprot:TRINITY_DN38162_c0_g1_i1.p1 TRINITY_DN38162_c0_g1~~TRINITY_DN38162_c0_g1_i1.p1  ORF type:complete len:243 (-),score=44.03 TRINITY_DN38162_c0_g1_i1:11-739(-)